MGVGWIGTLSTNSGKLISVSIHDPSEIDLGCSYGNILTEKLW